MKKSRFITIGALSAGLLLSLAACAPGSGTTDATNANVKVVTDPSKIKATTITEFDSFTDATSGLSKYMDKVNAAFMAKYPKIKVKRQTAGGDINTTLKLKISDPSGPDIVPANQGWAGIGDLSASGLLLNLDPYAKAYGWNKTFPSSLLQQHSATTDGKQFGTGSVFGVPVNQGSFVTVFYNRDKLAQLGLQVPTTLDQFESSLTKAKAAGITPVQIGLQDQAATAVLLSLQDAYGNPTKLRDFVYGIGNVKAQDTGMTQAADTFATWAKSGYFPKDYQGIKLGDSATSFVNGDGLYFFYYTGYLPASGSQLDKFGTFIMPRNDGKTAPVTGSSSQNFSIAKNSKSPDAAALYLNFISSAKNGQISIDVLNSPIIGQWPENTSSAMLNDTLAVQNQADKANGYLPYFDWATPTMLDTLSNNQSLLAAGKIDGAAMSKALQDDYAAFRAKKK
ncbi:MAG: putative Sugar transporter substrate-binding protein [Glaciihabitans sp.]|nr:putative Sugar transporter substrate-binding protein [Glaciihabitans sp.]MDQ1570425.1 raffinose/stachyose/melibiose transport system substrate-binding protein [Actinomycetota bacterium]